MKRKNERTRFGRVREKKEDSGGRGEGRELVNNVNEKSVDDGGGGGGGFAGKKRESAQVQWKRERKDFYEGI